MPSDHNHHNADPRQSFTVPSIQRKTGVDLDLRFWLQLLPSRVLCWQTGTLCPRPRPQLRVQASETSGAAGLWMIRDI